MWYRKGHLTCNTCRLASKTCFVCKQTLLDGSNLALDRLLSLLVLPDLHR